MSHLVNILGKSGPLVENPWSVLTISIWRNKIYTDTMNMQYQFYFQNEFPPLEKKSTDHTKKGIYPFKIDFLFFSLVFLKKKKSFKGYLWLSQLNICLRLRCLPHGPGFEPHMKPGIQLRAQQGVCFSLCVLALSLYLSLFQVSKENLFFFFK